MIIDDVASKIESEKQNKQMSINEVATKIESEKQKE